METWRKTVETEVREMGLSWGEAQAIAKDKSRWKKAFLHSHAPLEEIRTDDRLKELKILEGNRISFCGRGSNSLSSLLRLSVEKDAIRF